MNDAGFTFDLKHLIVDGEYYKAEQEERVEGIDGSFRWHQFLTITYTGLLVVYHHGILKFLLDTVPFLRSMYNKGPLIFKIQTDMMTTYGFIFAMICFNQHIEKIWIGTVAAFFLITLLRSRDKPIVVNFLRTVNPTPAVELQFDSDGQFKKAKFDFISQIKTLVMTITCIAIMAVDYPLFFDRSLAKAEDYGWSFMDVGVSAVMFAAGFSNTLICTHDIPSKKNRSLCKELVGMIFQNISVMIAASIRFILLIKIVGYHEHVTEWGVHWNFFVTIAVIRLLLVFVRSSKYAMFLGLALLLGSELIQKEFDLKTYIWHAPRTDFISANKEGLISLAGYISIQLIGMGIGRDIYQTLVFEEPTKLKETMKTKEGLDRRWKQELKAAFKMVCYSALFFAASELSYEVFDVPSRRLCNLSWVMYQLWILQSTHTVVYISDRFLLSKLDKNIIVKAISLNQLWLFIGSNLLCGLINITVKTLHCDLQWSLGLMYIYVTITSNIAAVLAHYNFKIPL